jgi:DNA polymerase III epsilon subunit-like protein
MLFSSPIIVWDTETTGLPRDSWAAVVDLGAVLVDTSGEIIDQFECLIYPDVLDERASMALSISGLTPEMLRAEGLESREAKGRAEGWMLALGPAGDKVFSTSFNLGFDVEMMLRMNLEPVPFCGCIMRKAHAEMGAAGALPRFSNGQYKFPKLSEAAEFYGVPMESPAHRALADAKTAAKIMVEIQRRRVR